MSGNQRDPAIYAFSCIVAADEAGGIGFNGQLPWPAERGDLEYFRWQTTRAPEDFTNVVIMGRRTWESINAKYRPLRGRHNIVISNSIPQAGGCHVVGSLEEALELATNIDCRWQTYVIGGAQLYAEAFRHPDCQSVYLTRIPGAYQCDTYLPSLDGYVVDPEWGVAGDVSNGAVVARLMRAGTPDLKITK